MGHVSKEVCKPLRCDTESRSPVGVSSDDRNDSSGGTRYCLDTGVKRAISPVSSLHVGGKNTAALQVGNQKMSERNSGIETFMRE